MRFFILSRGIEKNLQLFFKRSAFALVLQDFLLLTLSLKGLTYLVSAFPLDIINYKR